jgi:hypothetical protein
VAVAVAVVLVAVVAQADTKQRAECRSLLALVTQSQSAAVVQLAVFL